MSQFAVLLASQIPLKSGLPATRPAESAIAAETVGAFGVKSQKRPAVTAAADKALAQLLPKYRIGLFMSFPTQYIPGSRQRCEPRRENDIARGYSVRCISVEGGLRNAREF